MRRRAWEVWGGAFRAKFAKLDEALKKLRALPEDRQEAVLQQLLWIVKDEEAGESLLTDEQWAEVEASLRDEDEETIPHDQVVAELRSKFPG